MTVVQAPISFAVIVPTINERENLTEIADRLRRVLHYDGWEVIFVDDDSADGTAEAVRRISAEDPRFRCIQRIGRRGLSSAVIEGMMATSARLIAVIDADMQHDERILPDMFAALESGDYDLVVGSRYVAGGSTGDWDQRRQWISRVANRLGNAVVKTPLSDPMSGFFAITRPALDGAVRKMSLTGFKVLLDIVASSPEKLRTKEIAYTFRTRHAGESKLDTLVVWEYLMLLIDKFSGGLVPAKFVLFCVIGFSGLGVHMAVLGASFRLAGISFIYAQAIATLTAMTTNYLLNNWLTHRDRRRKGWKMLTGWVSFCTACSVGAFANVGIAEYLHQAPTTWWLAGLAGSLVGVVWNYVATSIFTWRK